MADIRDRFTLPDEEFVLSDYLTLNAHDWIYPANDLRGGTGDSAKVASKSAPIPAPKVAQEMAVPAYLNDS